MAIKPKSSTKHPYAAIEHRVIDSPAYADLTFSARALLTMLTRQLSKDNNGFQQATFSYLRRYGFSENTVSRGIAELISHGFVYRTRSGGYQQGAAQYALTWLPISSRRDGLFLAGFKSCAWRDWQPDEKKSPPQKLRDSNRKNKEQTHPAPPKIEAGAPPRTEDIELLPCMGLESRQGEAGGGHRKAGADHRNPSTPETAAADQENDDGNGYQRIRDCELTSSYWDAETGEFVSPPDSRERRTVLCA